MTYHNLCGWHPIPEDCTRIEGGNLSGVVFPTDREIIVDGAILLEGDYPPNIIILPSCIIVRRQPIEGSQPVQDIELAAKAELVFRSLIASGKLPTEMIPLVEVLLTNIKLAANVESLESGLAETLQTIEIITKLKQNGNDELASQIEQALQAVQAIWEAQ